MWRWQIYIDVVESINLLMSKEGQKLSEEVRCMCAFVLIHYRSHVCVVGGGQDFAAHILVGESAVQVWFQ